MALGNIPNDILPPLVYIDIDNSQALSGTPALAQKILVIGQQLPTALSTPLKITRIGTSESEADALYGKGSMISAMLKRLRKANSYTDVYALNVADLAASSAKASVTVSTTTVKAGVIALLIAGTSVQVTVKEDDTADAITTAIIAAINENESLPVTAALQDGETSVIEVTCKWTGVTGNDIDMRYNYYDGEVLPAGVSLTLTSFTAGAGTPDMSEVIAAIPDEWYNHIAMPFNDTQSMNALRDELVSRYGPLKMIEGIAYTAFRGTFAATGTYGDGRNDYLFTCMGTNSSPHPTWEWAASYCGIAAYQLGIDPARPLQTLVLPGILPPNKEDVWDQTERNLLLHDGIATYTRTPGGECAIEREVTMYKVNTYGDPDPSYLDITTPATLGYLRYSLRVMVTNRYPRHKLAGDDVLPKLNPGQPVVTPKLMCNAILELADTDWVPNGLVEDFEGFKETLSVYRDDSDVNRLNCVFKPDLVNQLRVFAALMQYKL
ncbi:MAG: phage tail sheath subtilisin-like domain-containing protein [Vibrio sp.]|uniref:phage tail sheath subtilisin-like domain-containing protein n=1 Tax=Vibrio sp. TaxID=678 RepID=UPI003A89BCF7